MATLFWKYGIIWGHPVDSSSASINFLNCDNTVLGILFSHLHGTGQMADGKKEGINRVTLDNTFF